MNVFIGTDAWVLASHNPGKIKELSALLAPRGLTVLGAGALGLPEPEETETSFSGNARLKAEAAAQASGRVSLADDSGLSVDALGGAPGVYSARWAGPDKNFTAAMARVRRELEAKDAKDHGARFVCVLALAHPDGETRLYEGEVRGTLTFPPRGTGGFGYDPVFMPDGHHQTFAEMDAAAKQALSHRARAFTAMTTDIFGP
ncbi:MAG: RdgB/HAM1 family non-canonical purine NTP pyrophosphatase [Oceanicaulis sp.]|nr:RdgB/HAM1 family non-canonical purine NTP pyrophosphatase [Oceanicaulis sp.]